MSREEQRHVQVDSVALRAALPPFGFNRQRGIAGGDRDLDDRRDRKHGHWTSFERAQGLLCMTS